MDPLTKAFLIPFIRVLQAIMAIILFIGLIYLAVISYEFLWRWNWKIALGLHVIVGYIIAVSYCYNVDADWWPDN